MRVGIDQSREGNCMVAIDNKIGFPFMQGTDTITNISNRSLVINKNVDYVPVNAHIGDEKRGISLKNSIHVFFAFLTHVFDNGTYNLFGAMPVSP